MAQIKIAGDSAAITLDGVYHDANALAPFMVKCDMSTSGTTTKVFRVAPPYACNTYEVIVLAGTNDPVVRVFGLDDDWDGDGAPNSDEKHELDIQNLNYTEGTGFDLARTGDRHFIIDQAWKALQFEIKEKEFSQGVTATVKVKAYRSGSSSHEGSYTTVTQSAT